MKRPDMKAYFAARVDYHVNGMMARTQARLPRDVKRVHGDVTSSVIRVEMTDGTEYEWRGGEYGSRKINGCYAPKMPKAV